MNEVDELLLDNFDISLEHAGVKGMKWGVRKNRTPGVSRKTDKDARKDAEEFARAKQFYGKTAGTRRKLIKAKVEGKSKHNSAYAKAFAEHLARQDTSRHADKAVSERKRMDRREKTKQRAGFLARNFTGEMGTQAAFTAVAVTGVAFLSSPRGRALVSRGVNNLQNMAQSRAGAKLVTDFLRSQGG